VKLVAGPFLVRVVVRVLPAPRIVQDIPSVHVMKSLLEKSLGPPNGRYLGSCQSECPVGFTTNSDRTACIPYTCPPSSLWPNCNCDDGHYGDVQISADGLTIQGSCASCPQGTWCTGDCRTRAKCGQVPCPRNSIVLKKDMHSEGCICKAGYSGLYVFDSLSGTYHGDCLPCPLGTWANSTTNHTCIPIPCPEGSEGYPNCMCRLGYVGAVSWSQIDGQWAGSCAKCPKGSWSSLISDLTCTRVGVIPQVVQHVICAIHQMIFLCRSIVLKMPITGQHAHAMTSILQVKRSLGGI
jgi:hypothetical protein